MAPASFVSLPQELHGRILGLLPVRQRATVVPLVCKQLRDLSRQPGLLWEEIELGGFKGGVKEFCAALAYLRARGEATRTLTVGYSRMSLPDISCAALLPTLFPGLRSLLMPCHSSTDNDLRLLARASPRLRALELALDQATEEALLQVCSLSCLTSLSLCACLSGIELDEGVHRFWAAMEVGLVRLVDLKLVCSERVCLPPSLPPCLTGLQRLNLSGKTVQLPSSLTRLTALTRVAVNTTAWSECQAGLLGLPRLCHLDITLHKLHTPLLVAQAPFWGRLSCLHVTEDDRQEEFLRKLVGEEEVREDTWGEVDFKLKLTSLCSFHCEWEGFPEGVDWEHSTRLSEVALKGIQDEWFYEEVVPELDTLTKLSVKGGYASLQPCFLPSALRSLSLSNICDSLQLTVDFTCMSQLTELRLVANSTLLLDASALYTLTSLTNLVHVQICVGHERPLHYENHRSVCAWGYVLMMQAMLPSFVSCKECGVSAANGRAPKFLR